MSDIRERVTVRAAARVPAIGVLPAPRSLVAFAAPGRPGPRSPGSSAGDNLAASTAAGCAPGGVRARERRQRGRVAPAAVPEESVRRQPARQGGVTSASRRTRRG
jgi:hypothetical protein